MKFAREHILFSLFVATYAYFLVGGILSYAIAGSTEFTFHDLGYDIGLVKPAVYALVGLASFILAYATFARVSFFKSKGDARSVESSYAVTQSHLVALAGTFVVGLIGFGLMIWQYDGQMPMLVKGSDEFRVTRLSSGLPQILYMHLVASALLAYAMIQRAMPAGRKRFLIFVLLASLFLILLGASRFMFLSPVVVIFLHMWLKGKVRTRWLVLVILGGGVAAFLIGLFRMGDNAERQLYLLRFVTDFAPEFREFARLMDYIPERIDYLNGQMFANAVYIVMPGKLLSLFGLSKIESWLPFGQFVKDLFRMEFAGGGVRAGLIAEYYANFGLAGIIVGFYAMGAALRYLEKKIFHPSPCTAQLYLIVAFSVATGMLLTFDAIVYKIVGFLVAWAVFYLIAYVATGLSNRYAMKA
jgi:hypothetical protein